MDGGLSRSLAVQVVVGITIVCGIPSAVSLTIFENQDWVWGLALMISGLLISIAVTRHGQEESQRAFVNAGERTVAVNCFYDILLKYLVPVEFIVMFSWWIYQSVTVYEPESWWNPLRTYSLGTCLVQWGVALFFLRAFNRPLATASTR